MHTHDTTSLDKPSLSRFPIVVMGVAGCGKSTLGEALAAHYDLAFFDADAFHPPHNVAKMRAGTPLNDDDRAPWLQTLNAVLQANPRAVLACSALKAKYREALRSGLSNLVFVHPHGSFELIKSRIDLRSSETGHYMPSTLLQSQFEALEHCAEAIQVDVAGSRESRVAQVVEALDGI